MRIGQSQLPHKATELFPHMCLRKLSHMKWQDRIPDTEVLKRANMVSTYAMLKRSQLRWAGHMCHISDDCLPKRLFYGKVKAGKCSHEGQKKHYKDTLKVSLKCGIDSDTWEKAAQVVSPDIA